MRKPLSPAAEAIYERSLEPEEFDRLLREALANTQQMERNRELLRWFKRRYPTARDRLAYARRKYAEWTRECEIVSPEEAAENGKSGTTKELPPHS
ncbi:MAG: hypothetical protein U0441_04745 [Polyangiaceae bacterium]